jgi:hypothetical protein
MKYPSHSSPRWAPTIDRGQLNFKPTINAPQTLILSALIHDTSPIPFHGEFLHVYWVDS